MKTAQAFLHPCILQCYCCSSHISSINLSAAAHSFTLFSPTKHPASCAPVPPQPPPPQALSHSDLTCASPTWGTEPSNNQAWVLKQQNLKNHFVLASLSCCYSCVHLDLSSKPFCPSWYRGSPSQMSFSACYPPLSPAIRHLVTSLAPNVPQLYTILTPLSRAVWIIPFPPI